MNKMYISESSKVVVQGITGNQGMFHTRLMLDYGTNIVAGVTPKKGGEVVHDIPVFDTVEEAVKKTGCNTSIIFVPARFTFSAVEESLLSDIEMTCIITENVPVFDMIKSKEIADKMTIIGITNPLSKPDTRKRISLDA